MTDRLVALALEEIDFDRFERFAQFALEKVYGLKFGSVGGLHDAGLDGYFRQEDDKHFIQISKQKSVSAKIRKTIIDIRKTREVNEITYVSSCDIDDKDLLEAKIQKDTNVVIHILDKSWLIVRCDLYPELKQYLLQSSDQLLKTLQLLEGTNDEIADVDHLSILTFVEMEAESLDASHDFNQTCVDSVIYEALEGTNPEKENLRGREDIENYFSENYPKILEKTNLSLDKRLEYLSSKSNNPRIRKHPHEMYGLPYDMRNKVSERNNHIKVAHDNCVLSISKRLKESHEDLDEKLHDELTRIIFHTIHETYRQQAINFTLSFVNITEDYSIRVFDIIDRLVSDLGYDSETSGLLREIAALETRHIFYASNDEEREYIFLLMKFYTVNFIMKGDRSVDAYFSGIAKRLKLYVGADIIVRMLSESLVLKDSRAMTNTIGLLRTAGVKLFVSRQTLSEVYFHIKNANAEFELHHASSFRHMTIEESKNFDAILIRAFYYAFLEPHRHEKKPRDWEAFLKNFGTAGWFDKDSDEEDSFASYLCAKYGFEFIEDTEIRSKIDDEELKNLQDKVFELRGQKKSYVSMLLARNDAEMTLFIEAERKNNNERVGSDIYGMNTWWLTEEALVLRAAKALHHATDTIMNPQFLMNHYFLDPTTKNTDSNQKVALPTTFGLRITDRISPEKMNSFLEEVSDLSELDDAEQKARVRAASNKLKKKAYHR